MGEFTSFKWLHTTEVAVQKSAGDIMALLGQMGANNVSMEMVDGEPVGMTFATKLGADQMVCYRLPVRWMPVYHVMLAEHKKNRRSRYMQAWDGSDARKEIEGRVQAQARRTAWRIAHEWLKVQCAFVSHGVKTAPEVFMSDMLVKRDGQVMTVGEIMLNHGGVALLTGGQS